MNARARVSAALSRYGVPLLLVSVALGQQMLVRKAQISPWKGAGFGMFATVDDPRLRVLRASLEGGQENLSLNVHPLISDSSPLQRSLQRARYAPTESALQSAAQALIGVRWTLEEDADGRWLEPQLEGRTGTPLSQSGSRLRLEVFSRTIDPDPPALRLERRGVLEIDLWP